MKITVTFDSLKEFQEHVKVPESHPGGPEGDWRSRA